MADRLRSAGHHVVAPDLPYEDPQTTHSQRIQPALDALEGATGPIVVVGHSLGAGYAPLVVDVLDGASLVYLCPPRVGPFNATRAPMRAVREGFRFPPDRADGTNVWNPDDAIRAIYPRLRPDVARALAGRLRPATSPTDPYPLTEQPAVRTSLIYALHDELFEPEWSRWVAREVVHVEPIALDTGHFPMIEAPDATSEALMSTSP